LAFVIRKRMDNEQAIKAVREIAIGYAFTKRRR
jgi:hypothetical protein